jgi:hypothetical protein
VPTTIPVPLRSGEYNLSHGTYSGDVGSHDPNNPATLDIRNHSSVTATVAGQISDINTDPEHTTTYYATFNVKGTDTLDLTTIGLGRSPLGPGVATVNLAPDATLSGSFDTTLTGHLVVNGEEGAKLKNFSGTAGGGTAQINADIRGTGTITMPIDYPSNGGLLELNGAVGRGETIDVKAGHLQLDQPMRFQGSIDWDASVDPSTRITFKDVTTADSYSYDGNKLHLFAGPDDILDVRVSTSSNAQPFHASESAQGAALTLADPTVGPNPGVPLPIHDWMTG